MASAQIFVASSSEGIEVARALQYQLRDLGTVRIWNEGVFGIGRTTIESLNDAVQTADFAVLVLRADDLVVSRGTEAMTGRDNVLFELGLFTGHLGRDRTFVVHDNSQPTKILSDLAGVAFAEFDGRNSSDLLSAVGPACLLVRQAILRAQKASMPNEVWHCSWHLGRKTYQERLEIRVDDRGIVAGYRHYLEVGGTAQLFVVRGFRGMGFDWLEYHLENGSGGGALLLRHVGSGKLRGLISAGHCDTGVLRCYVNQWVLDGSADPYDPTWLVKLGETS